MKDWTGNFHSVVGCLGASNHSKEEREENDFYATDPIAAEWLHKIETLSHDIWEPACGQGHLGKAFERLGYNVKATDLIDRGYGRGGIDFLMTKDKFDGDIVTNPPYKFAVPFIDKAMRTITEGHRLAHQELNAVRMAILRIRWLLMRGMYGKRVLMELPN